MRFHAPEIVYRALCRVAEAQHRSKASIICEALVRALGLEGIPLDPGEIYGGEREEQATAPPKK